MKDRFKVGLSHIRRFAVDDDRTIDFMGEDCRVYGTPEMIRDIEWTCRDLMFEHADPGEDSVGVKVAIARSAPPPLGMNVDISVTVAEIDRNRVVFEVSATDPVDTIGKRRIILRADSKVDCAIGERTQHRHHQPAGWTVPLHEGDQSQ